MYSLLLKSRFLCITGFVLVSIISLSLCLQAQENEEKLNLADVTKKVPILDKAFLIKADVVFDEEDTGSEKSSGKEPINPTLSNDDMNRIVTPGGIPFHRTKNEVIELDTIGVPGTALQIYTWKEEAPTGLKAFYAVSLGGNKIKGRVYETTYDVKLMDHTFDPLVKEPDVNPLLKADVSNTLYLVQFITTPLPEYRYAIELIGGKIHRFMTEHTFIVEMDSTALTEIQELPYVRWIGPYHPEFRVEKVLRDSLGGLAPKLMPQRYSIMVCSRGEVQQVKLSDHVKAMGGEFHLMTKEGYRLEATLTHEQLMEVVKLNEVQYVDRWGGPGETDMDIVRAVGGANYVEGLTGWTGQGVNGEIFDTELLTTHQEWGLAPIIHSAGTTGGLHGTSCYSINFATGVVPAARGLLPSGQGIFFRYNESTQFGGTVSRYTINAQLINPLGPYRAVFQTASVGSARTTQYTTISAETDDYLFLHQILSTQSQSNAGNQMSRPQAWAKNIVSCGGFRHYSTANRLDDHWGFSASIGPAADNRIKPDLSYFYDDIYAARGSNNTAYTQFGGTSAATPETSGHFGLMFEMWHNQIINGFGGAATVFDSRPQMATAKALMINTAYRYDWNVVGPNSDLDRYKQGWGTADVRNLYDQAPNISVINETDLLTPLSVNTYQVDVQPGTEELKVTMVYTDPMGTVGAAVARINDLSLKVTSPAGVFYWGNNGLTATNVSTAGGVRNTIDTVENVFLLNPQPGTWTVEVSGDQIVQDSHLETAAVDADYGLVVNGGTIVTSLYAPMPPFNNTYSNATRTRGFWFTAPTDFTITGLQVPDESGHGLQNVEVVRLNPGATLPFWPGGTNNFTSLYRNVGAPSANVLPTTIHVSSGDVIGILGACGDATMMHNSYGAGSTFVSSIYGTPVTFTRLGMQFNLAAFPAQNIFTSTLNRIGRIKMFYGPALTAQAPLPPYFTTYANATRTRGFWFTAPNNFMITGLQVPDESAHGLQNVEVVEFNPGVTPPFWPGGTNGFTSQFRSVGLTSSQVLHTAIPVYQGEVFGVLGACGDTTMMYNSYALGSTYLSQILGTPVTFSRLGTQVNLAAFPAQNVFTSNLPRLGRVKMFYAQINEALMPAFINTYTNPTRTRGYYFTAPCDFTLTGLQVPDESGHGSQNVEVIRFNTGVTPPTYPNTTNAFTSLHRTVGVSSTGVISMVVPVTSGDVIGIIGACGDATTMRNSYGAGPSTTTIFGNTVTLTRLGMQYNLRTTAVQNVWTHNYRIGRVKLFYTH